jgi:hypothetical protein
MSRLEVYETICHRAIRELPLRARRAIEADLAAMLLDLG